jgi:predicted permease
MAPLPVGFFLAASLAAGLSDNADSRGPGDGGLVVGLVLLLILGSGAAAIALPPTVRRSMRPREFAPAGLLLALVYPAAATGTLLCAAAVDLPGVAWVVLFIAIMAAYVYAWSGAISHWVGRRPQPR